MGPEAGILALRLGLGPQGWDWKEAQEEEEKKKKIPHVCESIGHRALWGRCPKSEQMHVQIMSVKMHLKMN